MIIRGRRRREQGNAAGKRALWRRVALHWRKLATAAAAASVVGLGYHVIFGQNGLTAFHQKRSDSRDLEVQSRGLQAENNALRAHVTRLESDPNAIEHQAREELHYTRPGEVIYTLPPAGSTAKH